MYGRRGSTKRTIITWTNTIVLSYFVETIKCYKLRSFTYQFSRSFPNNFKMVLKKMRKARENNSFSTTEKY